MIKKRVLRGSSLLLLLVSGGMLSGCANYEVNSKRGNVPGYWIRYEMQESDRAVEAARAAGKDGLCPEEFKHAEAAKDNAYDVFRACHTEEGAALAKKATAQANALCPPPTSMPAALAPVPTPAAVVAQEEAALEPIPAAEPVPGHHKYCITLDGEFDIGSSEIRPEYRDEIAEVAAFMTKYPTTSAVIEGHADDIGTDEYNMDLSARRADAVVNHLVEKHGIDRSRLAAKGYGKSRPVTTNLTQDGKQKNRRIEAIIDCAFDVKEIQPTERLCMTLVAGFDTGDSEIKPQYRDEIAKVGAYMKKYPTTTALIEGHSDNVGGYDYNMKLSQERAESVVAYLVQNFGIDRARLGAKGFGYTRRIAYNNSAEGRAKNRRINAIIDCVIEKK